MMAHGAQRQETCMKAIAQLVLAVTALAFSGAAFAQSYPDRPVRVMVGSAPGRPTDVIVRINAEKLFR
jgi:tripartite-type tricarboxylate transporter receptor subunit TctC